MSPTDWKSGRANRNEALKTLHRLLAADAPMIEKAHIRKRMKEREFSLMDVINVMERGKILSEGEFNDNAQAWSYRVETKKMFVVFGFDENATRIILITGQWLVSGRKL